MATVFEPDFELYHTIERNVLKCYDPNGHRQWARPSPRVFILKALNAVECEGLACEIRLAHSMAYITLVIITFAIFTTK